MRDGLDRRSFLRVASAAAALLGQRAGAQATGAAQDAPAAGAPAAGAARSARVPRAPRTAVSSRKNFVGIQVRGFAWVDEGIDQVLDNIQKRGEVNTVWAYTFAYGEQRLRPGGGLPDHGAALTAANTGVNAGALYDYDARYFQNTSLKEFRVKGYGKFNVIEQVAPKAKARGMDFFAWDLNNPSLTLAHTAPNYATLGEIDLNGHPTTNPCFNHPDYRAFLRGKIESLLIGYPDLVDGIAWGCERIGPLDTALQGSGNATCFCQFCLAKARELGISAEKARAGYREIIALFRASGEQVPDGYFTTFWRLLLKYPEVLAWETMWTESFQGMQAELYGLGKAIAPAKPFGFHIMQSMTFSPFYRAEEDYTKRRESADFLKLATYNNAGGPRMAAYLQTLGRTLFHDAQPQDFLALYYKIMNYNEAPFDQLASHGLSPDYVAKQTKRALLGVAGQTKIYPGIDIDVPVLGAGPKAGDKKTNPEDVKHALEAAFAAGADGVVLSREYVEMYLANLTSAGDTLRGIFAGHAKG
jgi:hypothetical protein